MVALTAWHNGHVSHPVRTAVRAIELPAAILFVAVLVLDRYLALDLPLEVLLSLAGATGLALKRPSDVGRRSPQE